MSAARLLDGGGTVHVVAVRCPQCGRRVTSGCLLHGSIQPPAPDGEGVRVGHAAPGRIPGYQGLRLVSFGGFGVVYEAEPEGGGRPVAIKLARDDKAEARRRLETEVRVLEDIGPPHVPAVLGRGEASSGTPYFVMEHLGDATLADRLVDLREPLPLAEVMELAAAILIALEAVHRRGHVHCDLKPENVFARAAGATIIDFGLVAGIAGAMDATREVSGEGPAAGTTEYMSPEQCEGRGDIDARADIYAMGVILHEMITGRPPFWGPRAVVREMHLSHRPPRLSAMAGDRVIPSTLEDVVACCLAKDRRERFASARDLLRAVEAARAVVDEAPEPAPVPSSGRSSTRSSSASERLTSGVVFFRAEVDPITVQARLRALGGQVVHGAGGRFAAVFAQELADNPVQRALRAAEELVRSGLCAHARVDLAPVVAQTRKDGTRRFLSPLFAQTERYPTASDPEVAVTPAASAVLPEEDVPASRRSRPSIPAAGGGDRVSEPPDSAFANEAAASAWPLVGRDDLVASLLETARATARGDLSTVITVTGDTGTGKTHLFREMADRLAAMEPRATLLALRAREPALGDLDRTLIETLGRGLDARLAQGGTGVARDGADLPPVLALALGRRPPEAGAAAEAPLRDLGAAPGALRSAMTVAVGEELRRMAAARPLFVLLDDAQFAGDVALAALEYASLAEARVPLWVCAIGRPSFVQDRPAWGERAGRREQLSLGPLDRGSAAVLCRRLLWPVETVPGSAVQHLVERAQGSPLLLVELVRGLRREGIVRRSPKGDSWYLATDELDRLPDLPLVEWLARREIDGLEPALRGHARLLALLGDHVTEREIEGVVRLIDEQGAVAELPLDAKVGTRRLVSAGVIVRDADGRFGYRHDLVRESLAHGAPEELRRLVHLAAVRYYRSVDTMWDERRLSRLAMHASAAGLAEEAARCFFVLAERARSWHGYLEAERLYSRVLDQPGLAPADRAAAHRGRGLMRYRLARYHDALADFSAARATAEDEGDLIACIDILLDEATALDWMDDFATSEVRVCEAEARMPPGSPPLLRARLLLGLGRSAMRFSRNEEAAGLLTRAAAAAEELGNDGYETLVIALLLLSFLHAALGREDAAGAALERMVALCEAHGDRLHLGAALNTRALLRGRAGEKALMVADMQRSLAIARELGQASLELMGEFNLGEHLLLMDDAAAAAPHIARALALDLSITGRSGRAVVALLEARLRLHLGDFESAAAIAGLIRERQSEARTRGESDPLLVPSDDVLCAAIELAARDGTAEQWDELEARSERFSVGQERIEVIEARAVAALRAGRPGEARRHLERAVELAAKIPNAMAGRLARRQSDLDSASN